MQQIKEKEIQSAESTECKIQLSEQGATKKKRKKQSQHKNKPGFKRALVDPRPLYLPDGLLTSTLKELVGQIHGDFGRASVTTGRIMILKTREVPVRVVIPLPVVNYSNIVYIFFLILRITNNIQQCRNPTVLDTNKTWPSSTTCI